MLYTCVYQSVLAFQVFVAVILKACCYMVHACRLVSQLRARTLDVVEALAAWHRHAQSPEPFMYNGAPYMMNIGPDLVSGYGMQAIHLEGLEV